MSNAYFTDTRHMWVFEVWVGEITENEVREHAYRHVADPNLRYPLTVLVDVRKACFEAAIGETLIRELCDLYRVHSDIWRNAKVAVISGEDFQLAALYARLAEARGVRAIAFNDLVNACKWLGIPYSFAEEGLAQARLAIGSEAG